MEVRSLPPEPNLAVLEIQGQVGSAPVQVGLIVRRSERTSSQGPELGCTTRTTVSRLILTLNV